MAEAWNTTVDNLENTAFADGTQGDKVRDVTEAVHAVINAKDGNLFGFSDVYLEGERAFIRNEETNLGRRLGGRERGRIARRDRRRSVRDLAQATAAASAADRHVSDPDPVTGAIVSCPLKPIRMPTSRRVRSRSSTSRTRCASTTS